MTVATAARSDVSEDVAYNVVEQLLLEVIVELNQLIEHRAVQVLQVSDVMRGILT